MDKYKEFIRLTKHARDVIRRAQESDDDVWKETYDYVFRAIGPAVTKTEVQFTWHDPDTTYQEDVTAYVEALTEKAIKVSSLIVV